MGQQRTSTACSAKDGAWWGDGREGGGGKRCVTMAQQQVGSAGSRWGGRQHASSSPKSAGGPLATCSRLPRRVRQASGGRAQALRRTRFTRAAVAGAGDARPRRKRRATISCVRILRAAVESRHTANRRPEVTIARSRPFPRRHSPVRHHQRGSDPECRRVCQQGLRADDGRRGAVGADDGNAAVERQLQGEEPVAAKRPRRRPPGGCRAAPHDVQARESPGKQNARAENAQKKCCDCTHRRLAGCQWPAGPLHTGSASRGMERGRPGGNTKVCQAWRPLRRSARKAQWAGMS